MKELGKDYLTEPINWWRSADPEYPYESSYHGKKLTLRLNDFPDDHLYTLMVGNEGEAVSFDEWPVTWAVSEVEAVFPHVSPPIAGVFGESKESKKAIGRLDSRYEILERLGKGAMGVVFLAHDTRLNRRVAVKFLSDATPQYLSRFQREIEVLSSFSHPNIAVVFDSGETEEGRPFIVMELLTGSTLNKLLDDPGLTIAEAVDITVAIGEALGEAHRHGIIHRDVKPSNVIVNERGHTKVLDFGLAKQLEEGPGKQVGTATRSDVAVGTPLYFSPEQASSRPVDARSDLFSLGVLLYECITGKSPFAEESLYAIGSQVINFVPPPPSKINPLVPAALDRITMKALAKKPDARYQSADEMIRELRDVRMRLSSEGSPTRRLLNGSMTANIRGARSSTLTSLIEPLRKTRVSVGSVILGVLGVALILGALIYYLRPTPYEPKAAALKVYNQGLVEFRHGAYFQASKLFQKSVELDERFALAHARLADVYTELDYTDRAKDELLSVTNYAPDRSIYPKEQMLYLNAITATVRNDFPAAIDSYRQLVDLDPTKPEVYADLGRAYEKAGDSKKAIESYLQATSKGPQYAPAFLRLGYLQGRDENMPAAEAAFKTASELYQQQQNTEGQTEVFYQRGQLYNQKNRIPEARQQLQQALDAARATNNDFQRIRSLLQLASVATTEAKIDEAHQHVNQAIQLAQANGMETLVASGLIDLANIYLVKFGCAEAEKNLDEALSYARKYKIRHSEARASLVLASLSYECDRDPDKMLLNAQLALPFYKQGNYRKETAQALLLIGRAYALKGNFAEAAKAFEETLRSAEQSGDDSQIALAHAELGIFFVQQEQFPKALSHLKTNLDINKSLNSVVGTGYALTNRGNALWQVGLYDDARADFGEAAAIAEKPGAPFKGLMSWLSLTRARMHLSEQKFADSLHDAQKSGSLAGAPDNSRAAEAKAAEGLASVFNGQKDAGKRACNEAFEIARRLKNQNKELLCVTQLALAEAMIETGDAKGASQNALESRELSRSLVKHDSEWRALMIAARAEHLLGHRDKAMEYATAADSVRAVIEKEWDNASYQSYLNRPDIKRYYTQLREILAVTSKEYLTHNLKEN